MKTCLKSLFPLHALIVGLGLMQVGLLTAQTFTTLHSFTGGSGGANPLYGRLVLAGNRLYGTAGRSYGTVFAVNTDGSGFTNLYSFTAPSSSTFPYINSDGVQPVGGLILSGNTLYGTANEGGSSGFGTVFAVKTNGTGFTNLYNFTAAPGPAGINSDGAFPYAGLILSGNTLYGTTFSGGSSGSGTVFALNTDGTAFTNLYSFTGGSDGAGPWAGLVLSNNILYGTASAGGDSGKGTVFALNTDGTGLTTLHSFTAFSGPNNTNSDGFGPLGGLILSGNTLYGTAQGAGGSGAGTIYTVNTDGSGFTTLHSFTTIEFLSSPNSDGARPEAGLILSHNTLYGTAPFGGSSAKGTVFAVNTDGSGFTTVHSFTLSDGANPFAGLTLFSNTLYGTTSSGGSSGLGTVFSLSLGSVSTPQLAIIPSGTNVILTWPTNAAGFMLQSTTNLVSPAIWTTNSSTTIVLNGQNTVTNDMSGAQMFYRLSQ